MAFLTYCPGGFLIVPDDGDDAATVLIQSNWDFAGVACTIGWQACGCGRTDGTVRCRVCSREVSDMLSEAYDYLHSQEGKSFPALNVYLKESNPP